MKISERVPDRLDKIILRGTQCINEKLRLRERWGPAMKLAESNQYLATLIALVHQFGTDGNVVIEAQTLLDMPKEGHIEYTTLPDGNIVVTLLREELKDG